MEHAGKYTPVNFTATKTNIKTFNIVFPVLNEKRIYRFLGFLMKNWGGKFVVSEMMQKIDIVSDKQICKNAASFVMNKAVLEHHFETKHVKTFRKNQAKFIHKIFVLQIRGKLCLNLLLKKGLKEKTM